MTLLNRVHVGMSFNSEHGVTQQNSTKMGMDNPFMPFDVQAQAAASWYNYQTVSTFRFSALSVGYDLPPDWLKTLRLNSANVAIQGSNLGLRTNYLGKDPNVNSTPAGMSLADDGAVPQPRTWSLTVRLGL